MRVRTLVSAWKMCATESNGIDENRWWLGRMETVRYPIQSAYVSYRIDTFASLLNLKIFLNSDLDNAVERVVEVFNHRSVIVMHRHRPMAVNIALEPE